MPNVLVSGAADHVASVADKLRARGATVTAVDDPAAVPAACAAAGPGVFDTYVQLGAMFRVRGDTAVRRVHHFFAEGVLARFTALAGAIPSLRAPCQVVFVLAQLPDEVSTTDLRDARQALVRVLAHSARADVGDSMTVRVIGSGTSDEDIAMIALGKDPARQDLLDRLSDLSYHDWRIELLGLAQVEA